MVESHVVQIPKFIVAVYDVCLPFGVSGREYLDFEVPVHETGVYFTSS